MKEREEGDRVVVKEHIWAAGFPWSGYAPGIKASIMGHRLTAVTPDGVLGLRLIGSRPVSAAVARRRVRESSGRRDQ